MARTSCPVRGSGQGWAAHVLLLSVVVGMLAVPSWTSERDGVVVMADRRGPYPTGEWLVVDGDFSPVCSGRRLG